MNMAKAFGELTEREILALAISNEEDDGRVYGDIAAAFEERYPSTAKVFREMQGEESEHRRRLIEVFRTRFGEHIPLIRKADVKGFIARRPVWLITNLGLNHVRKLAESMEIETRNFYLKAAARCADASTRKLLGDLADAEIGHIHAAEGLEEKLLTPEARAGEEAAQRRMFLMQVVQPGLAGLMDGSVSTLAPLFAAAFATHNNADTFRVGLAASVGAGISMGFAEALSDDGALTGRGHPWIRGVVCGLMTTLGGIFHTLPYVIPLGSEARHAFYVATAIAIAVVVVELFVISWIRNKYMDTPFLAAAFQVVVGGALVFAAGIFIGGA
jgi:rubrerythrin